MNHFGISSVHAVEQKCEHALAQIYFGGKKDFEAEERVDVFE